MVHKAPEVPECPIGLANLLQNLLSDSTQRNQEVIAQSGDENGVFATCSTEGDIVLELAARLSVVL